jgi:chromosome partitioning protein
VHLIDSDPQADLTSAFGYHDPKGLLYQAMGEQKPLPIVELSDNLSLTPSSIDLTRGESNFLAEHGREFLLQGSLKKTELPEDTIVIIDCPPSLALLTVNCLAAADKLVVTVHPGGFEMKALVHLQQTVGQLKKRINRELELVGVLMTICDMRKTITEAVRREVKRQYELLGLVRQDTALEYATARGDVLNLHQSHAMGEYAKVAEVLEKTLWAASETVPG